MRIPKYLSPSAIDLWTEDRREYYIKYLADVRCPKVPQDAAMSVGSAFDSYIKAHITNVIAGKDVLTRCPQVVTSHMVRKEAHLINADGSQCLDETFVSQYLASVEPQNDKTALRDGWIIYQDYIRSGSLARLLTELPANSRIAMESTVSGFVPGTTVPLSGKPDLYCILENSSKIWDWKVNGYYSKKGAYPNPAAYGIYDCVTGGYIGCGSKFGRSFEEADSTWATQLLTYGWCLGLVDPEIIIDQIAYRIGVDCKQKKRLVATTRGKITKAFADDVARRYISCWEAIKMDHVFTNLPLDESRTLSRGLDKLGAGYMTPTNGVMTSADAYFNRVAR